MFKTSTDNTSYLVSLKSVAKGREQSNLGASDMRGVRICHLHARSQGFSALSNCLEGPRQCLLVIVEDCVQLPGKNLNYSDHADPDLMNMEFASNTPRHSKPLAPTCSSDFSANFHAKQARSQCANSRAMVSPMSNPSSQLRCIFDQHAQSDT